MASYGLGFSPWGTFLLCASVVILVFEIHGSGDYPADMKLRGCGTALVTPFKLDGSLDEAALRELVRWQVESGIDFLVPCGTTGETPTLSHDEWLRVVDLNIEQREA